MLLHPWLSRCPTSVRASGNRLRKTRRRAIAPVAAHVQSLEPRVLLTATPVGGEFQVNTYTTGNQQTLDESPQSVAMDADGDFVVTWTSYGGQDGSGDGVYAQRYNAAGAAQGSEFQVNSYTTNNQRNSTVAMDADGDFVVTWTSYTQDGSRDGIYAQRYNAAGAAQGNEFRVNTSTTDYQSFSTVAMDSDGDFVVTWSSFGQDGSSYSIYAQRYNAAGVAQGSEFRVNTYTTNYQFTSTVAMDADGDFVVTWLSYGQDGSNEGIYAQRYNAAGAAQGSEFRVNTYTTNLQGFSTVAMDADGDFVVTWSSSGQDGSAYGVFAQRYNAAGVAQGNEFRVNTYTTDYQSFSTVAMDTDGDFVVTWSSYLQDGSDNGIYAQRYNAAGVAQGSEFRVNTYTTSQQLLSTVAMDADGDFVVAWSSLNQDGSGYGVYAQRFSSNLPNLPPVINNQTFAVAENRPVGHVVGTVVATDPNAGQTLTYAITAGNTGNVFAINAATGQITVTSPTLNFEGINQYNLTVLVTDNGTPALSDTATVTVNITNLNEAPSFLAPTTFTIAENRPVGQFVGDVNTSDPEGHTVTYSLVGGDPNAQFAINATTGVITVAKSTINFEATPQFLLQVKAQDNGSPANSRTQTITVNIANLNEAPTFLAPTTFTISENRPVGHVVGDVNTSDPEGHTVTYSLVGGDPNAQFAINATTGVITVAKSTISFEATPQFLLQVKAQDNGSPANSRTQTVTVNVLDLNEQPFLGDQTIGNIAENSPNGTVVGTVGAYDQDAGQTLSYAITGGNTGNAFAINATTGQVTVATQAALDFETTPTFNLQITVTDNGSPQKSRTATGVVNLIDQTEPVPGAVADPSRLRSRAGAVVRPTTAEQTASSANVVTAADDDSSSDDAADELYSFLLSEPLTSFTLSDPLADSSELIEA